MKMGVCVSVLNVDPKNTGFSGNTNDVQATQSSSTSPLFCVEKAKVKTFIYCHLFGVCNCDREKR